MRSKLFAGFAAGLTWTMFVPVIEGATAGPADFERFQTSPSSNENRGNAYVVRGLGNENAGNFARALLDYTEAIRMEPKSVTAHYHRGCLHYELGNLKQAIADLDVVIKLDLNYGAIRTHLIRGHVHAEMGQRGQALADYAEVIQRAYTNAEGRGMRAEAYKAKGDYAAASADYARARQMSPRDDVALNALAWFRATCPHVSFRNGRQAVEDARRACEITKWDDGHYIDTLAAACAEAGDFGNAVKYQTQAISKSVLSAGARKEMEQRLRLFKQRKPWREKSKL